MSPPLIYNLFPRLVGPITRWSAHVERARRMHFNWLFLNPWHYPGFSGSLYAPKEHRRLNPLFLPVGEEEHSLEPLRRFLSEMRAWGMPVMMDLVVNHTSKDSPLIEAHPGWYLRDSHGAVISPFVRDPDDASRITVWGDLAEIDNAGAADRVGLWNYWAELVRDSLARGFSGFRCDAAYKVPAELWKVLIGAAREVAPDVVFFAETLGAPPEEVLALREAGFDYFFNSSKWWDFRQPWALEQHEQFGRIAPSISFPESHDTPRLAAETGGDEARQRQRYSFAAAFSAGVMMPIGYEFGFQKEVNVVRTMPSDWERRTFDLTTFITRVNRLKIESPVLHGEGRLSAPRGLEGVVLLLERRTEAGTMYLLINTDAHREHPVDRQLLRSFGADGYRPHRICRDGAPLAGEAMPEALTLERAEVVYLMPG
jgi:starch synthase (maltosyl-transferring)